MATMTWTYTVTHQDKTDRSKKWNTVTLQGSSGTYLSGGISISAASMGLPYGQIDMVDILDSNGDGYIYQWNRVNGTIQMFETIGTSAYAASKLTEVTSAVSPSSALTISVVGF
jgi:hypothetical protein